MNCLELTIPPLPQLVTIGHTFWPPGQKHETRSFDVYDLLFVLKGTLYMMEDDVPYEIKEGSMLVLEPNRMHTGYRPCEEITEIYWIHFVHPAPVRTIESGKIPWSFPYVKGTNLDVEPNLQVMYLPKFATLHVPDILPFLERMMELHHSLSPAHSLPLQMQLAGLLVQLQAAARLQNASRARQLCDHTIAYLQQHLTRPFDAKHMEQTLHYRFDYLARCLKTYTGMSPLQYLHDLQIKTAKSLLENMELSVSEVGQQVGIDNPNYFIRLFRKQTGITPGKYRNIRIGKA
ncbi:AraC family transcriptional regulator [Paenibacillus helianthi]|uniref:AraC family transcriptional regulator n=1 Tax=Paenibacillus helianthi TaxID=1349432 RepID=A0ABX3ELK3_9BACL|nr:MULTISPECIES: AraC family transcriptional regulator [Paenibacillus]OKP79565.1 AraC family transcriptional regulator [Paenibacillus sp. P3E]OKP85426.1 AraC family transcriptional regulator [Paenibacillus helianthi]